MENPCRIVNFCFGLLFWTTKHCSRSQKTKLTKRRCQPYSSYIEEWNATFLASIISGWQPGEGHCHIFIRAAFFVDASKRIGLQTRLNASCDNASNVTLLMSDLKNAFTGSDTRSSISHFEQRSSSSTSSA